MGFGAGVIAATFVCPLDVIKTRLQVHGLPQLGNGSVRGMPFFVLGLFLVLHSGNHLVDFFRYFFVYISNSYSGFSSYKVHIFVFYEFH